MSGTVVDAQTGAALSWTNVFVFELLGTSTDAEGRFRLETGAGTHTLRVTRVGYVAMEQVLEVPAEGLAELVLRLQPQVLPMAETLVERRRPIPPTFEDVTAVAGLAFEHVYGEGYLSDILEATGAGACFFDYNGDGFAALYFVNGSPTPPRAKRRQPTPSTAATATAPSPTSARPWVWPTPATGWAAPLQTTTTTETWICM